MNTYQKIFGIIFNVQMNWEEQSDPQWKKN